MSESWKTDGDCETCRRKPYCKKSCTLHRKFVADYMKKSLAKFVGEKYAESLIGDLSDEDKELFQAKWGDEWEENLKDLNEALNGVSEEDETSGSAEV